MTYPEPAVILLMAFVLDHLLGDPVYPYHPARLMGKCISFGLRLKEKTGLQGRGGGTLLVLMVTAMCLGSYLTGRILLYAIHPYAALGMDLFICYSCIAAKDLVDHVRPVVSFLQKKDLQSAREAVSKVVGRNVQLLDDAGVARAAVETLSENFVDGVLSPVFWYTVGAVVAKFEGWSPVVTAVCLMILFKAASTLDSMVGYKNDKFIHTGWAGARLDDLMNFFPARISILFLFFGAYLAKLDPRSGIRTAFTDRLKHESPNSAHAESFVAGALGVRLGGPTAYSTGIHDKPWLNEAGGKTSYEHVLQTIRLVNYSAWIFVTAVLLVLVVV